jgi:hypothetical protein
VIADLLATTRGLEFVDVPIHGDRRASVSHLPLDAEGIEAALSEVGAVHVRVPAHGRYKLLGVLSC